MKTFLSYIIGSLCLLLCFNSAAQGSLKQIKKDAFNAYEAKNYHDAVKGFKKIRDLQPDKNDFLVEYGISLYHINELEAGLDNLLKAVQKQRRYPEIVDFYIARSYHHMENFDSAAEYYKKYIVNGDDDKLIEASKAHLLRCEAGNRIVRSPELLYVDNMGNKVNTELDEFNPILSPNSDARLYFSAHTPDLEWEFENKKMQQLSTDMYSVENIDGIWRGRKFMNSELNTDGSEILYGFSSDGMIAYYFRGSDKDFGSFHADTFGIAQDPAHSRIHLPMQAEYGDRDPFFINDSTLIFSAIRAEGYGGYDLYISHISEGEWTTPQNLGPELNSPYNERSPFLSADRGTLIFSSDRPQSMGGYDFFMSEWNPRKSTYENVRNMGRPLNSPGNDMYFTLAGDGVTCFFSSDRKTSHGGYDLYTGYFKKPLYEKNSIAASARDLIVAFERKPETDKGDEDLLEKVTISSIIYTDGDLLSPVNKRSYDKIVKVLSTYPATKLRIQVFSTSQSEKALELYFAIKSGDDIADYIKSKGIDAERIQITGCGSSYPLAGGQMAKENKNIARINNRVDFHIENTEDYPLSIGYELPRAPQAVDRSQYIIFNSFNLGLSYRIQVASYAQKYSSKLIEMEANPLVHKISNRNTYKYTVGLFKTYRDAERYLKKIKGKGHNDAFIVPYINGMMATRDELNKYREVYPDLDNYFGVD